MPPVRGTVQLELTIMEQNYDEKDPGPYHGILMIMNQWKPGTIRKLTEEEEQDVSDENQE